MRGRAGCNNNRATAPGDAAAAAAAAPLVRRHRRDVTRAVPHAHVTAHYRPVYYRLQLCVEILYVSIDLVRLFTLINETLVKIV